MAGCDGPRRTTRLPTRRVPTDRDRWLSAIPDIGGPDSYRRGADLAAPRSGPAALRTDALESALAPIAEAGACQNSNGASDTCRLR